MPLSINDTQYQWHSVVMTLSINDTQYKWQSALQHILSNVIMLVVMFHLLLYWV